MMAEPNCWLDEDQRHFWWEHDCPEHQDRAAVMLPLGPEGWQLVQAEPLTISPSILCSCGVHGFFTNGEWRGV